MNIENPITIASEEIAWLKKDGTEVLIQARISAPYPYQGDWACPASLDGVDGRYPDIVGASSIQALCLAIRLIRRRLEHLLESGEILVYQDNRECPWSIDSLNAIFGPN